MPKKIIYKYSLNEKSVNIPPGYKVLMVGVQNGSSGYIWCEVDPDVEPEPCGIKVLPTGAQVPDGMFHIGSFSMLSGQLIWHVYDTRDSRNA